MQMRIRIRDPGNFLTWDPVWKKFCIAGIVLINLFRYCELIKVKIKIVKTLTAQANND
jgi:hypothetical protein